jgi:hypothetical protein
MNHIKSLLFAGLLFSTAATAKANDGSSLSAIESISDIGFNAACAALSCDTDDQAVQQARAYLVETARPGGTMIRQGSDLAIERLHPDFAKRLAHAIRAARSAGLTEAGIFSAYRPPVFGVGGFADKFYSLHAYGLAVDMYGVGGPGSSDAEQWHQIAAEHGIVCPYGYRHRVEWNHCQPTHLQAVSANNPLRGTITGAGPIDLDRMFDTGSRFIADARSTLASVFADRVMPTIKAVSLRLRQSRPGLRRESRARVAVRSPRASRGVTRIGRTPSKSAARARVAMLGKRSK